MADFAGHGRHARGEFGGTAKGRRRFEGEAAQQGGDGGDFFARGAQLAVAHFAQACCGVVLAFDVPAELDVIGEDQVGQGAEVAPHLLRPLDAPQVFADVFGLHETDGSLPFQHNEIRRADVNMRGVIDGDELGVQRLQERLKRRAIGVFSGFGVRQFA